MPITWYLNDDEAWTATGSNWITTTTTSGTSATSTCYLTIGGTNITQATCPSLYVQPQWVTDCEEVANDAQWRNFQVREWRAFQVRAARVRDNMARADAVGSLYANEARPASPAIIRERSETERQRDAALVAEQEARRLRATEAGKRARELLLEHLTPEQRRMFEANNWFIVEGGRSKEQYRIRTGGYTGNVEIMKNGKATHTLCGHCEYTIPLGDQILAQKLMLEHAEDDFLRIANRRTMAL